MIVNEDIYALELSKLTDPNYDLEKDLKESRKSKFELMTLKFIKELKTPSFYGTKCHYLEYILKNRSKSIFYRTTFVTNLRVNAESELTTFFVDDVYQGYENFKDSFEILNIFFNQLLGENRFFYIWRQLPTLHFAFNEVSDKKYYIYYRFAIIPYPYEDVTIFLPHNEKLKLLKDADNEQPN